MYIDWINLLPGFCTRTQVGGFYILINFHEEPLGVIKLDASSREAGQDSGINLLRRDNKKKFVN
jgi:hypothetical protein